MATIIKNNTENNILIEDIGVPIDSSSYVDLTTTFDKYQLSSSKQLYDYILAGTLIINDGESDLSIENGIEHITIRTEWEEKTCGEIGLPDYTYINDETESLSSSTLWTQKLRLVTPTLMACSKYRLNWSFEWHISSASSSINIRIQINDTNTIMNLSQEKGNNKSNIWSSSGGFYLIKDTNGSLNIDLDFSSGTNNIVCGVRKARLDLFNAKMEM